MCEQTFTLSQNKEMSDLDTPSPSPISGAFYYMWQANRSMGLWADMIGCFVTIGAATFIITDKTMSAGEFTYIITI